MLEEFEDTKGVIRIRISKKNRQHNGQKKKDKRTNNDLQNTSQKTKDRATQIPLKSGMNTGAPEGYVALAPLVAPLVNNTMTTHAVYVKDKYTVATLKKSCYCDNCFN